MSGSGHSKANIRAVIRVRPETPGEKGYIQCASRKGMQLVVDKLDYNNKFSTVLGPGTSQADIFHVCGLPMVDATIKGQNTCLFAYGQTGAGKTFSMYGAEGGKNPSKLDGLVPGICSEFFRRKQEVEKGGYTELRLAVTLVEVQGSLVCDLLADGDADGNQPELYTASKPLRGSTVMGAQSEAIYSSRALTQIIEKGMSRRKTDANFFHLQSSRSHAFLTMTVNRSKNR